MAQGSALIVIPAQAGIHSRFSHDKNGFRPAPE
jgi:hypothetical protein